MGTCPGPRGPSPVSSPHAQHGSTHVIHKLLGALVTWGASSRRSLGIKDLFKAVVGAAVLGSWPGMSLGDGLRT